MRFQIWSGLTPGAPLTTGLALVHAKQPPVRYLGCGLLEIARTEYGQRLQTGPNSPTRPTRRSASQTPTERQS